MKARIYCERLTQYWLRLICTLLSQKEAHRSNKVAHAKNGPNNINRRLHHGRTCVVPDGFTLLYAHEIDKRLCAPALEEFSISMVPAREQWFFDGYLLLPILEGCQRVADKLKNPYGLGVDSAQSFVVSLTEDFGFQISDGKTPRLLRAANRSR